MCSDLLCISFSLVQSCPEVHSFESHRIYCRLNLTRSHAKIATSICTKHHDHHHAHVIEGTDPVQVNFEPPRLSLAGGIDLAIGPKSQVKITTTYLTPQVRIGRGGRGSAFIFTKGGASDDAGAHDFKVCRAIYEKHPARLTILDNMVQAWRWLGLAGPQWPDGPF